MATAYKPHTSEEVSDQELEARIKASAEKAHRIIQKAREKMTPEEREKADAKANEILDAATAAAKALQRRA